jgi:hypothetical protein
MGIFRIARPRLDLMPGTIFIYRGPRKGFLGPGRYAIGEVLAFDEPADIVHVRTLIGRGREGKGPIVRIGHIPIRGRDLLRDLVGIVGRARPDVEAWESINAFRRGFARGEVGAFEGRLWKAERRVRRALPPERASQPIRHTFVRRTAPTNADRARESLVIEVETST